MWTCKHLFFLLLVFLGLILCRSTHVSVLVGYRFVSSVYYMFYIEVTFLSKKKRRLDVLGANGEVLSWIFFYDPIWYWNLHACPHRVFQGRQIFLLKTNLILYAIKLLFYLSSSGLSGQLIALKVLAAQLLTSLTDLRILWAGGRW